MRVDPPTLPSVVDVPQDGTVSVSLRVFNDGDQTLSVDLSTRESAGSVGSAAAVPQSSIPILELAKGEPDPRKGPIVVQGFGGPDATGYRWIDSNETGGPSFDWIDISSTGTRVNGLFDDNHVGPFPIGFDFDFYDRSYSQFYIQSNGLISFDNRYITLGNQSIPRQDGYNNLIAWMWDDLYPYGGSVYYQMIDGNKLVVQFDNYGEYRSSGRGDAQLILFADGAIKIQYLLFATTCT